MVNVGRRPAPQFLECQRPFMLAVRSALVGTSPLRLTKDNPVCTNISSY